MSQKSLVSGAVGFAWLAVCAALASGFVLGLKWALYAFFPQSSLIVGLVYGLIAPFAVVLFALLVEQTTNVSSATSARLCPSVRYISPDSK